VNERIFAAAMRVRPWGRGFAAEGPGFFVWDEDRGAVVHALAELEGRPVRPPPTAPQRPRRARR
jgi:hypothetical protein